MSTDTINFSSSNPQRGSYIVYIAGVEVPAISVSVTSGVWQIPTIQIELAPDRELIRLGAHDRLPVAVFYLDNAYTTLKGQPADFRLLAEGEIIGWQYKNTSNDRSMVFTAVDYMSGMLQLFPYFMTNYQQLLGGAIQPPGSDMPTAFSSYVFPSSLFFTGVSSGVQGYIKRPFDFLDNILKALCGQDQYKQFYSSVASNFFSRWIRKNNFLNRFAPSPIIETNLANYNNGMFPLMQLLQSDQVIQQVIPALARQGERIANASDTWELLKAIFTPMYYEISINPAPACVTTDLTGNVFGTPQFASPNGPSAAIGAGSSNPTYPVRLLNYVTKPATYFCVPPSCNVIYPSMITAFTYAENYLQQPTRAYFNDETLLGVLLANSNLGGAQSAAQIATTVAAPLRAQQEVASIISGASNKTGKNFLIWPDEYFIGPTVMRSAVPSWFLYMAGSVTASNQPINDNTIYQLYANYEFLRKRAEAKNGAIVTIFNPYVVAGHPGVIFDNTEVGNHVFSYFTTVTHNLAPGAMSTQIGYNYAQTLQEFFTQLSIDLAGQTNLSVSTAVTDQLNALNKQLVQYNNDLAAATEANDAEKIAAANQNINNTNATIYTLNSLTTTQLDMCPASPIPIVQSQFQNIQNAGDYYNDLFYQSSIGTDQNAAFSWRDAIGLYDPQNPSQPEPITFTVSQPQPTQAGQQPTPAVVTSNIPTGTTLGTPQYVLLPPYDSIAQNAQSAIIAGSRPITTLEQYIDFAGDHGVRRNPQSVNATHGDYGGTYYEQILDFVPGPGATPQEVGASPNNPGNGNITQPVTAELYQDWAAILLLYRQKVLYGLQPYKA